MKVYVVTHAPCAEPLPEGYEYIQVNAANNEHFCPLTDDTGENISEKNPRYCELTAIYWIWKNGRSDSAGLAHYRRFLTQNRFSSSPESYLRPQRAEALLRRYDFLATKQYKTKCTVKEHLLRDVRERDFLSLRETVSAVCPDYLGAFDAVFSGHKSYLLNIFFCKKAQWDAYCSWLFSLLEALERRVDMTGYSAREQRLYGFLGERLFTVYVLHNRAKVKSFPTHIVGEPLGKAIAHKLKRMFGGAE